MSWTLSVNMSNSTSTITTGDRSGIEVNTPRTYTGEGNLAVWLKKVDVWAALKGYSGEKKALVLALRLDGPAFECYARKSEEHQKHPAVVVDVLKQDLSKQREIEIPLSTSLQDDLGTQVSLQLHLHMMFAALLNWHIPDLARMRSIP